MLKKFFAFIIWSLVFACETMCAKQGNGFIVTPLAPNAVRIQYTMDGQVPSSDLPDWLYVKHSAVANCNLIVETDADGTLCVKDKAGRVVFRALRHELKASQIPECGEATHEATLAFFSPANESLFGLGQFQDGYANVRGLSRRLTQVNTQISLPMLLSSKGYGILWNNYGLTEFNPCNHRVILEAQRSPLNAQREEVNVTSTEGG